MVAGEEESEAGGRLGVGIGELRGIEYGARAVSEDVHDVLIGAARGPHRPEARQ